MNLDLFLFRNHPGEAALDSSGKKPVVKHDFVLSSGGEWGIMPPHTNH